MVKPINYSKWDHIELSDDECDDLPQHLDKDSFKKYTKAKRQERDHEEAKDIKELKERLAKNKKELKQLPPSAKEGQKHIKAEKLEKQIAEDEKKLDKLETKVDRRLNADTLVTGTEWDKQIVYQYFSFCAGTRSLSYS